MTKLTWKEVETTLQGWDTERAIRLFADHRPPELQEWAEKILERQPGRWPLIRRLVRAGLIQRPEIDAYWLGMLDLHSPVLGRHAPLLDNLLEDRGLLDDLWRLFEVEGGGELSLANRDKYCTPERSFSRALVELAARGELPRARLLDASLDALARDFSQYRAGWFSRFHEALEPTLEERAQRLERYLELLASKIPPTVRFALDALERIEAGGGLSGERLVPHVGDVMTARAKGTVLAMLKLVERAIRSGRVSAPAVLGEVARSLSHEAPEVQSAGWKIVEKHGDRADDELVETVRRHAGALTASLRSRVDGWIGAPASPEDLFACTSPEGPTQSLRDPEPLLPIQPLTDLDDLLEIFGALLEDPGHPDEVERVLDGVSRLCGEKPSDLPRRAGPLVQRARNHLSRTRLAPFQGRGPLQDLCGLALAWLAGECPRGDPSPTPTILAFMSARVRAIALRAQEARSRALLAAPTHAGGWIDPGRLVSRCLEASAVPPEEVDQVQALLRLSTVGREEALGAAGPVAGELGAALRHALGGSGEPVGPSSSLWIAAARARAPFEDDPAVLARHPDLGPDAGQAARLGFTVVERDDRSLLEITRGPSPDGPVPVEHPTVGGLGVLARPWPWRSALCDTAGFRWSASCWPSGRESWFAEGALQLADNLDWWEARWDTRAILEPLLDPRVPLRPMAMQLLLLGAAAKEPGESGLATEALIAAIEEGRLEGEALGGTMAALIPTGLIKAARWARTFREAARPSSHHARILARAIEHSLAGDAARAPRDLSALLELLNELLAALGRGLVRVEARDYLTRVKAGGKTAKLVRALLDRR